MTSTSGGAGKPTNGEAGEVAVSGSGGAVEGDGGEGPLTPPWVDVVDLPADIPAFEAGSRLRARVYVSADGSHHFSGWRDTELELDCRFRRLQVRQDAFDYYCVPETPVSIVFQSGPRYADAACTVAAVDVDSCDGVVPPYRLYTDLRPPACEGSEVSSLQRIGEPIQDPYVRAFGDVCTEAGLASQGQGWRAIAPADLSTFVRAEMRFVELGGGLYLTRLRGEDGTSEVRKFSFENTLCRATEVTGAGARCVPDAAAIAGSFFADASCARPTGDVLGGCGASFGTWTRHDPNQDCAATTTLWDFRPIRTDQYFLDGVVCRLWDQWNPVRDQTELIPRDPTTVPALEVVRSGAGRLRSVVNRTAGGSSVGLATIYDSVLGLECAPREFEDGTLRCVPTQSPGLEGYFDSDCSSPVVASTCAQPPYYVETAYNCRLSIRQVYSVGTYVQSVWQPEAAMCNYVTTNRPYRKLVPVPNDTFAEVTEKLDDLGAP
jgi:hypothetical protein